MIALRNLDHFNYFTKKKSRKIQASEFPGELILKLLAQIGEWHQNLSEKTVSLYKRIS